MARAGVVTWRPTWRCAVCRVRHSWEVLEPHDRHGDGCPYVAGADRCGCDTFVCPGCCSTCNDKETTMIPPTTSSSLTVRDGTLVLASPFTMDGDTESRYRRLLVQRPDWPPQLRWLGTAEWCTDKLRWQLWPVASLELVGAEPPDFADLHDVMGRLIDQLDEYIALAVEDRWPRRLGRNNMIWACCLQRHGRPCGHRDTSDAR